MVAQTMGATVQLKLDRILNKVQATSPYRDETVN